MPANLADVISGTVDDVSQPAALDAFAVWALVHRTGSSATEIGGEAVEPTADRSATGPNTTQLNGYVAIARQSELTAPSVNGDHSSVKTDDSVD